MMQIYLINSVITPLVVLLFVISRSQIVVGDDSDEKIGRQTLADLIAAERLDEKKNPSTTKADQQSGGGGTLSELIRAEGIQEEEFDQFVSELEVNERLVEAMFVPKQQNETLISKVISKMVNEQQCRENELEEKCRIFKTIKETDPALSQLIEQLQLLITEIRAGAPAAEQSLKLAKFKELTILTIELLALRQRIAIDEIVPLKDMNKRKMFFEFVKLLIKQKRKNKKRTERQNGQNDNKNGQNDNKNGQNGNKGGQNEQKKGGDKQKQNKHKEKRFLQLLRTAVEQINVTGDLALQIGSKKQKRRTKRGSFLDRLREIDDLLGFFIIVVIGLIAMIIASPYFGAKYVGEKVGSAVKSLVINLQTSSNSAPSATQLSVAAPTAAAIRQPAPNVISEASLQNVPTFNQQECAVCLSEFTETKEKTVSTLQPCGHKFHTDCVTTWITRCKTCPVCRAFANKISKGKKMEQPQETEQGVDLAVTV